MLYINPTPKVKPGQKELDPEQVADSVSVLPFFIVYILFPLAYLDFYGYLPNKYLFGPIFIFVLIPILDYFVGLDGWNPTSKAYAILEKRNVFKVPTMMWLPSHVAFLYWALVHAHPQTEMYSKQWWGLVFNAGIAAGVAINFGHELIHKNTWYEHYSGCTLLSLVCYGHFSVEHIQGHHVRVATLEDPASSRLNENLYLFLPRSIVGGAISAFHLNFRKSAALTVLTVLMSLTCPKGTTYFFFLQGLMGILYLEVINYVEHYGLERKPNEPVTPLHSWNSSYWFVNAFLVQLMRHSDHHAYGGRRYQSLRTWPWSPQMPFGYATMILLALVPPIWYKVMNPRVHHARKVLQDLKDQNMLEKAFTESYLQDHSFVEIVKKAGWY